MQRILVTGANSFVGKHLIPFLVNSGHEVQGIIRKVNFTEKDSYISIGLVRPNLIGDLSEKEFLKNVNWSPDVVIHLAANSGEDADVSRMFKDNILSAANLYKFAERMSCPKVIVISSISVHGKILNQVVSENTGFVNPSIYGFTKRATEMLFQYDTNIASTYILRLPAVLGVGASKHWISRVFQNALNNNEIEIHNPHNLFNNAIYIHDLLRFIEQLLLRSDIGAFAFPLASTKPLEIKTLVDLIIKHSNSNSKVLVSKEINNSFTIDDRYARENFSYNSLSVSSAIKNYVEDSIF